MIISIIIILFVIFFIGETKITFSPFSFKMENWQALVGWILLVIAFSFLDYKRIQRIKLESYIEGASDLAKALEDDLIQKAEQLERDKKIKDEKLKNSTSTSSNTADESADSTGL